MSNTLKRDVDLTENNKLWQHEWSLIHRVHLHEELKRRATSTEYQGYPVELRTACPVIEVDPASATATLEGGELVRGDVLLGADGVKVGPFPTLFFFLIVVDRGESRSTDFLSLVCYSVEACRGRHQTKAIREKRLSVFSTSPDRSG